MSASKRLFRLAGWRKAKSCTADHRNNTSSVYGLRLSVDILQAVAEGELMAMSRAKSAPDGPGLVWVDEAFTGEYPDLTEFLSETQWDDGKKRLTGTLIIATEGRSIKAKVCDRDGKRGAWVTSETFEELLRRIDTALHHDNLDWRKETR